jgi:glycosyltransferase involved in cell wall biosynthesis
MRPKVSIITPSFNQCHFLERTIQSVLKQDYPDLEYIIVDGGSVDGSLEIIKAYEDTLAAWISEPDLGQADAINKGFGMASGQVLAWLNSDDEYRSGAVSQAVEYLQSHPEIGMVYARAYYIDEDGRIVAEYPAAPTDYHGLRRGRTTIPQQTMFFRSVLWDMVGPLDPTFYYAMDYDLWVRIAEVSPIAFNRNHWAHFRLHGSSKSMREAYRCWPEMMRVHFRDGGSRLSLLYAKYLVRRMVEPIMPWRIKLRKLRYSIEQARSPQHNEGTADR